jgi:hypothetical protein
MARELMMRGDWPVQAAKALGLSDYLDLLPNDHAWRLERREEGQAAMRNTERILTPAELSDA